jgi:hypothetical protein
MPSSQIVHRSPCVDQHLLLLSDQRSKLYIPDLRLAHYPTQNGLFLPYFDQSWCQSRLLLRFYFRYQVGHLPAF